MKKLTVLLCLVVSHAFAADPPDWYAHIPAKQRAALLTTQHAGPPRSLLDAVPVSERHGQQISRNVARQFDASALVHPPQYDLSHHNRRQAIVRAILRDYRTPDDGLARCWRVGKRDQL